VSIRLQQVSSKTVPYSWEQEEEFHAWHAGPGFSLTFSLGNCTFDPDQLLTPDGALECFGPSVSLQQTPLTFTSAYKQAASFTGEVSGTKQSPLFAPPIM
jgi:hypothetical protein